jgi:hypothetical protein
MAARGRTAVTLDFIGPGKQSIDRRHNQCHYWGEKPAFVSLSRGRRIHALYLVGWQMKLQTVYL